MIWGTNMKPRIFTERLDIKMTPEDMLLLAEASLKADMPLTVYARQIILDAINPMIASAGNGGGDECERARGKN